MTFKSNLAADDVMRNFELSVLSAILTLASCAYTGTCFRGLLEFRFILSVNVGPSNG